MTVADNGPSPDWDRVPVRWRGRRLNGSPCVGSIIATASMGRFIDEDVFAPVAIFGSPISEPIDGNGFVEMWLPATDDPDIEPNGFIYTITENLVGDKGISFDIAVPLALKDEGIELVRYAAGTQRPPAADPNFVASTNPDKPENLQIVTTTSPDTPYRDDITQNIILTESISTRRAPADRPGVILIGA